MRREHPNWGKKRIARWIWKEHGWERVVAIETVRNVLNRHGLWKNGKRKKKRKNKGTTADSPNKTINIDLCFVHAKEAHEQNFSAFFQRMDKKTNIEEMERKAGIKREDEALMAWRRPVRIERRKEDEEWRKYREDRIKLKKRWKKLPKDEKKGFTLEEKISDGEWWRKRDKRKGLRAKRDKEDEKWRNKRKGIKEKMNVTITSLVAILVILDNCRRRCLGLPVFIKGRKVTADDVIKALENRLPPELKYIISDNGKQFVAEAFKRLCTGKGMVHVRITRHRPATNGIADSEASLVKLSLGKVFCRKIKRDAGREGMGEDLCVWHQIDYNKTFAFRSEKTERKDSFI